MHLGVVEIDCADLPRGAEGIDQSLGCGPIIMRVLVCDRCLRSIRPGGPYVDIQPVAMLFMAFERSSAWKTDIADAKGSELPSRSQPVRHSSYCRCRASVSPLTVGARPSTGRRAVSIITPPMLPALQSTGLRKLDPTRLGAGTGIALCRRAWQGCHARPAQHVLDLLLVEKHV